MGKLSQSEFIIPKIINNENIYTIETTSYLTWERNL